MGSQLSRQRDGVHPRDKGMAGVTDKRCENLVIRKDNRTLYGVLLSFKKACGPGSGICLETGSSITGTCAALEIQEARASTIKV